jgi:hypothetical protein
MSGRIPGVRLLDAHAEGLGRSALRSRARAISDTLPARYVTRSYRYPHALIAWHSDRVGVDIERIEPSDQAFADSVCTPDEQIDWASCADSHRHIASLWSGKEALAKALGDALSYDPRRLGSPIFWPDGRACCWRARRLAVADDHVAWLCWRIASDPPAPDRQENIDRPLTTISTAALTLDA